MTHSPVVLVYVYTCKHVLSPVPQDIWAHEVSATQASTPATSQLPVLTSTPRKPICRASPGQTYVNMCIWVPHLLMVLSAIQSLRRSTWAIRWVWNPKFFILPGIDWCVTTVNSSLTRRHIPKALLPFFCPTKPRMSALAKPCMASMQESHHSPHQIKFDTDSQKFLIDFGASAHLWNHHKDFISYRALSFQERKNNQVLGVSANDSYNDALIRVTRRVCNNQPENKK